MAFVGKRVSTRVGLIGLSMLAGIATGIGNASAEEGGKKGAEASSASVEKSGRARTPHKVATQKLMRKPWERAHKGPEVASTLPPARK